MTGPKSTGLSVSISHDRCVGIGMCVLSCPGGFDFDATGQAVFKPQGEWTAEELSEAADSCPSSAIEVYRDGVIVR